LIAVCGPLGIMSMLCGLDDQLGARIALRLDDHFGELGIVMGRLQRLSRSSFEGYPRM
jgi:hypothetical protein